MDLYNKYRPQTFADMFSTSPCISSFDNRIDKYLDGNDTALPQSFMFYSSLGGVGKTTVGRLFAVKLNRNISDHEKKDILGGNSTELFTSLNGGDFKKLDDFRTLSREIQYRADAIWGFTYVYMINEAHNITPASQELLLELVENLPSNIFMIFTTTELSAMHEKLMTRLETHEFRPMNEQEVKKLLVDISAKEKYTLQDRIADDIYRQEGGSARACIVALGSYINTGSIYSGETKPDEIDHFSEIINILVSASLNKNITWINNIKPVILKVVGSNPVQARSMVIKKLCAAVLNLPYQTSGNLTAEGIMKMSDMYETLIDIFSPPPSSEPWHDMILRTFKAYKAAIKIRTRAS